MRKLCFVMMPFGIKSDASRGLIDFDAIYREIIAVAIKRAGLDPLRADEEQTGGLILKPLFERLMLCDVAVADLTTANPNVYYELGIRHGIRPFSTVLTFAARTRLPFDVGSLRAVPYALDAHGKPASAKEDAAILAQRIEEVTATGQVDSPFYQLLTGHCQPEIDRRKTDEFRERMNSATKLKDSISMARQANDAQALDAIRQNLGPLENVETSIVVDLFLSYRAVEAWRNMVDLSDAMDGALARTVMVREQKALALNRVGRRREAKELLLGVIAENGPSSETCGILGRVYKDMWQDALAKGEAELAKAHAVAAIKAYLDGFDADPRDAYPGINAVTLMEVTGLCRERQSEVLPVVCYAMQRRVRQTSPDYWDYATMLELAVLARDASEASNALGLALAHLREPWEAKSTANNLGLIARARREQQEDVGALEEIIRKLEAGATV